MEAEPLSREAKDPRFDVITKGDGRFPLRSGRGMAADWPRLSDEIRDACQANLIGARR